MASDTHDDRALPAGAWHGNFAYGFAPDEPHPTQLLLEVDEGAIKGAGVDEDGEYDVAGAFDPWRRTVRWQKRYRGPGGVAVAYVGRWDPKAAELHGRWRVVNTASCGRFTLRPGLGGAMEGGAREARAFLKSRAKEWQALCAVDLEAVRFDGERAVLAHLLRDPDYVRAMGKINAAREEFLASPERQALSSSRVRLRKPMVPGLYALLDRCVAVLGLKAPVELYVQNDGAINASVVTTRDKRIVVEVTAGAINQLDPGEMTYVLGHELGHAVLGHLETPRLEGEPASGLTTLRSFALQRYEEISADRVGLLCCDDVHTALRAEFIFTTGIVSRAALGDPRAFLEHARRAVDALERPRPDAQVGLDTHPYGEMRALAIDLFGRSKTFHALLGRAGGEVSEEAMEREVARLVRAMNPSVMEAGLARTDVAEFLLLGAISVAEASGKVSSSEALAIKRLARDHGEVLARLKAMPFEEQQIRMIELAEVLAVTLPAQDRVGIVEDLTVVASADGRVTPRERATLDGLAMLLCLPTEGVGDTLGALDAGLD